MAPERQEFLAFFEQVQARVREQGRHAGPTQLSPAATRPLTPPSCAMLDGIRLHV